MKLAAALFPSPPALVGLDNLEGLEAAESAFVLSLLGPAESAAGELGPFMSWPCLFKRGSRRVSLLAEPDLSSGRSDGDTV